jgi:CBS domain-containing membrane protein
MRKKWPRLEAILSWLRTFWPAPVLVNRYERMRACGGVLIGVVFKGILSHFMVGSNASLPWLVAPIGASAVLVFGLQASPLAQPWSVIGGNTISAIVGVSCAFLLGDSVLAAAVAVAAAIAAMFS